jgi:transcriptional regulator with GAF, ATPase, and Fis domain
MDHTDQDKTTLESEPEETPKSGLESIIAPYDVDIDLLAAFIIPKIDFKESIENYTERILQNLAKEFEIVQGVFYLKDEKSSEFCALSTYAWASDKPPATFIAGEGLTGQVAKNKTIMNVNHIPENYITVISGLGSSSPENLLIVPLLLNKETIGIIELSSFRKFDDQTEWTFKNLAKIIANGVITKLKAHQEKK